MYVRTHAGSKQEPMLYGSFVGTLGINSLPAGIQKLLDEVRKCPQDYKPLLLTIIFDPLPGRSSRVALSDVLKRLNLATTDAADAAAVLLSHPRLKQIVWELEPIRADLQKRDAHFQHLIDAELKLGYEMMETARGIRPQKHFEPFLLQASLLSPVADVTLHGLGLDFAKKMLPAKLTQRIMNSAVSVGHLTYWADFSCLLWLRSWRLSPCPSRPPSLSLPPSLLPSPPPPSSPSLSFPPSPLPPFPPPPPSPLLPPPLFLPLPSPLQRFAEVLQSRNTAFKQRVEQERKSRK